MSNFSDDGTHSMGDEESNTANMARTKSIPVVPKRTKDGLILVDWYYNDDPMNPHNWSNRKRLAVSTIICLYTFVVYTTSAIYTTSEKGVQKAFHVSEIKATLGLALYVLGYGSYTKGITYRKFHGALTQLKQESALSSSRL